MIAVGVRRADLGRLPLALMLLACLPSHGNTSFVGAMKRTAYQSSVHLTRRAVNRRGETLLGSFDVNDFENERNNYTNRRA